MIKVTIKPKNMVGNSWANGARDPNRKCPLAEALEQQGHGISYAQPYIVNVKGIDYVIPDNWEPPVAREHIRKANDDGDETEITVELTKLNS